jgi:bile acid:Na+ symporter, BASS family
MTTAQLVLSLVLATMVFSVALELRVADFQGVARNPRAVIAGLVPQFLLLPLATWGLTMVLDLPPNTEAAMILVASCPGGALSNVVTHLGRGNTALSVSISAVASLLALVLTPLNFTWMVSANPVTAGWLRQLSIDASDIWISLLALLAVPMLLGMAFAHRFPVATARIRRPLARSLGGALLPSSSPAWCATATC